jgi:ABC-type Fe3+-siderophore transport system permease subunit
MSLGLVILVVVLAAIAIFLFDTYRKADRDRGEFVELLKRRFRFLTHYYTKDVVTSGELEAKYMAVRRRNYTMTFVLFIVAIVVAFFSILCTQYTGLTIPVAFDVLITHLQGGYWGDPNESVDYYYNLIIWDYYTPRAIVAVFAGAGLAVGGCVMQSLMRNPLADPYTTGVASGASFGAALFIMLGIHFLPIADYSLNLSFNAILFSFIPTIAIIAISRKKNITPTTMILAGVAVMYIFRASTSLMTLAADPEAVEMLYTWNVGSVAQKDWSNVAGLVSVTTVCSFLLMYFARDVTIMTAGDRNAKSMGVNTRLVRVICLGLMAVLTAIIVGYTGTIGFMGLVAPHVARMLVGSNMRYLLPCSAACGAVILVVCDLITKTLTTGLPVGVITAIVGGPVFIILLIKGAKKVWY